MNNCLLEPEKTERIITLTKFIQSNPEVRELKRALAVRMALEGEPYAKISNLLGMKKSSITTWKQKFEAQGLEGIKLGYQGSSSYLTSEQRKETITWLQSNKYCTLKELVNYLDKQYGVVYQSLQSYYALLSAAHINRKKSPKVHPKPNPETGTRKKQKNSGTS
ncbi:transposase [Phormidium sp. LEGE 05292]|uniref:helix-turn-helix domain-containing protein n=1 Tax=[Phormidium] sp. LEGE 05292 TaxID=767427 RepID=UPI00187F135C|nr:helix-turn-helix domain-containing protein [Phormidium sp. LEGE 05292]MBE9228882.1 transposase [Phormidium sp. LEGE 05292]